MDNTQVCLLMICNQPFENNIVKLERLYRNRFPNLDYLAPFINDAPHLFAVHQPEKTLQGYFSEVYPRIRNWSFSHYIFCSEDLILNPQINAANLLTTLKLERGVAYFKNFTPLVEGFKNGWSYTADGFNVTYQAWFNQILPNPETAALLIERHGIPWLPFTMEHLTKYQIDHQVGLEREWFTGEIATYGRYYPYPLAYGFSGFLVVPHEALNLFCHYCGEFANLGLFSEIAIPTALLFSCDKVVTEDGTDWRGAELWDAQLIAGLRVDCQGDLGNLLQSFQTNQLYNYPVKTLQWSFEGY